MTTIRQELKPYLEMLTERLKGKYFVLSGSVYKIHTIESKYISSVISVTVENLKTKKIIESDWSSLVDFEIFEFESDEVALLYNEVKEEN